MAEHGCTGGLSRRRFLKWLGAGAAAAAAGCRPERSGAAGQATEPAGAAARRPNVLVIVADDLGYADLGVQGSTDIPTPHIDALARGGVRMTSGYVSCPVCSPTRAGLMTGRYQQRFGHEFNPGPPPNAVEVGLPATETTLAQVMKDAGYATGCVGKWHLGSVEKFLPLSRGFQEFFGFPGGAHPYTAGAKQAGNPILRGRETVEESEYLTDALGREAAAFIDRHAAEPFFLYLAFNAVHNPLQAPAKYLERFPNIVDEKHRTYAAMASAMDDAVGRVMARLAAHRLDADTLVFFFSDNGGPAANTSSNRPLRGQKGTTWEGGIRVPFFVRWTGWLPAGGTYAQPVISLDVLPTAAAIAGAAVPKGVAIDGVNLLPHLAGERTQPPHEALFWRQGGKKAVRKGRWKLVIMDGPAELFDLDADIAESKNLAADKPDVLKDLTDALAAWEAGLVAPRWRGPQRAAPRPARGKRNAGQAAQQGEGGET
jgi:arylsulfatase A-like enzyme